MAGLALVLAGGGVAGIAWETGFLLGLEDESPDLADAVLAADLWLGTSAGSAVAAQLGSGLPLRTLFDRQVSPVNHEIPPGIDMVTMGEMFAAVLATDTASQTERLRAVGSMALHAATVDEERRRRVIEARLPSHDWPTRALSIPAIDVDTGELVVFDRGSGVALVDAVAASCAVPGVWPPVTIGGRRYMDGGVATSTNLHLAEGHDRVVVLAPTPDPTPYLLGGSLAEDVAAAPAGVVYAAYADPASVAAFGPNPLDPEIRRPAALAGRAQGRRQAAEIATFLGAAAAR
ncbi:patatin-like phospholipase family protein [Rhodococcus olei]|uniref:Patatin-like phospholipase family protein n=1 Tax=Rhodococcus olei TaxID=2161675 RepID=A0ABP8NUN5_9NOCA